MQLRPFLITSDLCLFSLLDSDDEERWSQTGFKHKLCSLQLDSVIYTTSLKTKHEIFTWKSDFSVSVMGSIIHKPATLFPVKPLQHRLTGWYKIKYLCVNISMCFQIYHFWSVLTKSDVRRKISVQCSHSMPSQLRSNHRNIQCMTLNVFKVFTWQNYLT